MASLDTPSPPSLLWTSLFLILILSFLNIHFHFITFPSLSSPILISNHKEKKGGLEGLEEGLARARAAIVEAGRRHKYIFTSFKNDTFIPTGSVYRNPYAFHQSYTEMDKRLKVWVYKEGEPPLFHRGPMRNIYAIEGHFIDEIESPGHRFAATHPDEAHVFFLPVSVTKMVHYLYRPKGDYDRGRLQTVMEDYVRFLSHKYPYWNRSDGADHFYVACHDWGPFTTDGNPKLFKNMIRVICNANVTEGFNLTRDVTFPEVKVPPIELNPPDFNRTERPVLAFFAGGAHGYIRQLLLQHWKDKDKDVEVHEYLPKNLNYFERLSRARFCLCPSGYEVASPRLTEAMHVGCVPVVISDGYPLPLGDVLDWSKFSVTIPVEKIPEIKTILENIPMDEYLKKQKEVMKVKRHFVLHRPAKPYDVLNMVFHSVWLRRLNVRLSI